MDPESLRSLYAYHDWATDELLDLAAGLPHDVLAGARGRGYGSVVDVFAHLVTAEMVWLHRWTGGDGWLDVADPTAIADIRRLFADHQRARWAFFDGLTRERLSEPVRYTNRAGGAYAEPLGQLMLHVVVHGAHHRSEVCEALTTMGRQPPPLDYVHYLRRSASP